MYLMLSHAHGITKICLSFERKQPYLKEVSLFLFHEYVRVWFVDYDSGQLMYIIYIYEIYIYAYNLIFGPMSHILEGVYKGSPQICFFSHQNGGLTSRHRSRYPVFDV